MGRVEMSKCLESSSCHSGRTDFVGAEVFTIGLYARPYTK